MKTPRENYYDVERIVEFDFVRATESAALNAFQLLGRGDETAADLAACDAIRGMFDLMNICGEVVMGETKKLRPESIFRGEHLGTWLPGTIKFDLALDPIDGSTNVAKGRPNAISCIAAANPSDGAVTSLKNVPAQYMMKLAYGPRVFRYVELTGVDTVSLLHPVEETIEVVAKALGKRVQDVVVVVLNRPRHDRLVEEIRRIGAALRMIQDGDITAAMAPSIVDSGIDLYMGIGGGVEAVLAAAGIRCLGGDLQCRVWPVDADDEQDLAEQGFKTNTVFRARDLASGNNIIFCATGISDSPLLRGVQIRRHTAITYSVLMRARSKTVRFLETFHDLERKTIRLRSDNREHRI